LGYAYCAVLEGAMAELNQLMWEMDKEAEKTRKVLEAIPEDADFAWKPHPKSMSLGSLAGHVSDVLGQFGLNVLTEDKANYAADHDWEKDKAGSKAELLEKFDRGVVAAKEALAGVPDERWAAHWKFIYGGVTYIDEPRWQVYRELVMNHMVHHRAQLGVYIRLVGGKVPGCFGPSADES
jgi:uncharacterized damage-inducible protein DinB